MEDLLLQRLEAAVEGLLEKNRQLQRQCDELQHEKNLWQEERERMLAEVERILARIDSLPGEGG